MEQQNVRLELEQTPELNLLMRLFEQNQQQKNSDWARALDVFQYVYYTHVLGIWASFYNQLHSEITGQLIQNVEEEIEKRYERIRFRLESKLRDPQKVYLQCLEAILQMTHPDNQHEKQPSMMLFKN